MGDSSDTWKRVEESGGKDQSGIWQIIWHSLHPLITGRLSHISSVRSASFHSSKPRFHRIRMLQKLPRGNRTGGLVALSREQQLVKRPTGLTSMITNWLEGSVDQCICTDRMIFEGVIFFTSDTQTQRLSVTKLFQNQ